MLTKQSLGEGQICMCRQAHMNCFQIILPVVASAALADVYDVRAAGTMGKSLKSLYSEKYSPETLFFNPGLGYRPRRE